MATKKVKSGLGRAAPMGPKHGVSYKKKPSLTPTKTKLAIAASTAGSKALPKTTKQGMKSRVKTPLRKKK